MKKSKRLNKPGIQGVSFKLTIDSSWLTPSINILSYTVKRVDKRHEVIWFYRRDYEWFPEKHCICMKRKKFSKEEIEFVGELFKSIDEDHLEMIRGIICSK